jgi:hypothetical protein
LEIRRLQLQGAERQLEPRPRKQLDVPPIDPRVHAVAVVFDLVQPIRADWASSTRRVIAAQSMAAVARFREPMVWTLPCRRGRVLAIVANDANNQVDRRKLSRSFTTLLEALNRHRGKGSAEGDGRARPRPFWQAGDCGRRCRGRECFHGQKSDPSVYGCGILSQRSS